MEARDRVAVPVGEVATALGPADHGKPAHPHRVQPRSFLRRGEVDVGLGPAVSPVVRAGRVVDPPVEARAALPVLPGQLARIPDAHSALLGRADEEQAAQRPVRLAAQARLRLLVEQQHLPARFRQFRGRGETRQPGADHDHVAVRHRRLTPSVCGSGAWRAMLLLSYFSPLEAGLRSARRLEAGLRSARRLEAGLRSVRRKGMDGKSGFPCYGCVTLNSRGCLLRPAGLERRCRR